MTPEERLACAVHDLDAAPDDLDAVALADQLQLHGRLSALRERDLASAVAAELRYEEDSPRFAAEVVGKLKADRVRGLPRVASLAAAALFLALTGWVLFRDSATPAVGKNALLVVGRIPLGPGDRAVADRLERLGFAVEAAMPDAFDPSGRKLVAISSTVLVDEVREVPERLSRLRELPVPLLVWEPRLYFDLGFTAEGDHGSFWAADEGKSLRIDSAHPLAGGLTGTVDVVPAPERLSWARVGPTAIRAAGLEGSRTALFGYERGSWMDGGIVAPARRVGLFLFDTTAVRLTEPGKRLVDAAVLWAAGETR